MRTRIALVLSILASLIWVLALPLWVGRYALSSPTFYLHWLRKGDIVARFTAALANELPRQVPESNWWPWLPRSPEKLAAFFNDTLATVDIEAAMARVAPSWAGWMLGETGLPRPFTPSVALYLRGPHGHTARDFFWRALPSCEEAAPPACISLDPDAHRATLAQQRAWWDGFVDEFIILLETTESRLIVSWVGPPGWLPWLWTAPLVALALMIAAALVMPVGRKRWAAFSVPLLTGGLIVGVVGVFAALDRIPSPAFSAVAGTPWRNIWLAMYPALWRAAMRTAGPLLIIGGALSLAAGIAFAALIFEGWRSKLFAIVVVLSALVGVAWLYFEPPLAPLSPRPIVPLEPTTTPLPTATNTPVPSTATPTPVVDYWPVQPGTPIPTPSGAFAISAQQLGCYQAVESPIAALRVVDDKILTLGSSTTSQRSLPALEVRGSTSNALPVETYALSQSGEEIAVANGLNLYVYTFPSWARALRSRVSVFSRIQVLTFTAGQDQLAMGLENGFLWVIEPSTGRIVWLLSTNASPMTALVAHPEKLMMLSGAADGKVRLWDMHAGEALAVLQGHGAAITHVAFAPQGDQALSVDADGLWTLWDLPRQRILGQRRLLPDAEFTALVWNESGIVAGTSNGDLVFVTEDFVTTVLPVSDVTVTALTFAPQDYALIGTATGQVCVWGTLDR